MQLILSNIFISIGVIIIFFGIFGIHKYRNFYTRILIAAKIDSVGAITILIGIAIKHGFSFFTLKTLLLLIIIIILEPLTSHIIARTAYLSGYKPAEKSVLNNEKDT